MSLDTIKMKTSSLIESILFFRGEPTSIKKLSSYLKKTEKEIIDGLEELENSLQDRGISLIRKDDEVQLSTSKEASSTIETLIKEELHKDLGKAGLETLSIVLYMGPVSKSEIDFIRGVSSSFILRNLLIRGLVERIDNPEDKRSFLYRATFELLSYLGVKKIEDLPEYETTREEFNKRADLAKEENEKES